MSIHHHIWKAESTDHEHWSTQSTQEYTSLLRNKQTATVILLYSDMWCAWFFFTLMDHDIDDLYSEVNYVKQENLHIFGRCGWQSDEKLAYALLRLYANVALRLSEFFIKESFYILTHDSRSEQYDDIAVLSAR